MNSFKAIAIAQNTNLAVVAPGIAGPYLLPRSDYSWLFHPLLL